MAPEIQTPVSVEEFWHLSHGLPRAELVAGQVVELVLPGFRHGVVVGTFAEYLRNYARARRLGVVVENVGFVLSADPPTVRGPDVALVFGGRMPAPPPVKFFPGPPDLAVEVLSPDDRPGEVAAKVADYLRAGTLAVWVADPEAQTVAIHTRDGITRYGRGETLRGAPPLPGLELPLEVLFADPA
jgi:Uma2 family endonuclease